MLRSLELDAILLFGKNVERQMCAQGCLEETENCFVGDKRFLSEIAKLAELREFLSREGVWANNPEEFSIAKLECLIFRNNGRLPTQSERMEIEYKSREMLKLLSDNQRRRFYFSLVSPIISWLPVVLLLIVVAAFFSTIYIFGGIGLPSYVLYFPFALWLLSMAALGSVASIGMNVLSMQDDITFDVTNLKLVVLRIVVGCLFGVMLSFSFTYNAIKDYFISSGNPAVPIGRNDLVTLSLLLLPFLFGFSTPLVILVIGKLLEAVGVLFGTPRDRTSSSRKGRGL